MAPAIVPPIKPPPACPYISGCVQSPISREAAYNSPRQAPYIANLSVFHLFIWLLNRLGVDMENHMASALHVGHLSVRMRNDRHEPNGAEKQRPERIPVDPEHHSCSRNVAGAVTVSES